MKQVVPKRLTAVLGGNINKEANFTIRDCSTIAHLNSSPFA